MSKHTLSARSSSGAPSSGVTASGGATAEVTHSHITRRTRVNMILLNGVLFVGLVISLGPLVWMGLSSFKPEGELRQSPPTLWPQTWTTTNFADLFSKLDFPRYFWNSIVVAVFVTVGAVFLSALVGYALAKIDFPGRRALFVVILATLMVPGMVTFVPLFVLVSNMGILGSYAALILPYLAAPLGVFLMRQFMADIPDELIDAARVDGAGELRTFFSVVLPQTKPALAALGILTFLGSWNNFLWPLVAVKTADMYTLPVALATYTVGQNVQRFGLQIAGATVIVVPILIVFLFLQRHFVQGIATTGLK